jgi:hypothetical protein
MDERGERPQAERYFQIHGHLAVKWNSLEVGKAQTVVVDAVKLTRNLQSGCLYHQLACCLFQKALVLEHWEAALTYQHDDEKYRAKYESTIQ